MSKSDAHSFVQRDSGFDFDQPPLVPEKGSDEELLIPDITKYIPIGCIRLLRSGCAIEADDWNPRHMWGAFYSRDAQCNQIRMLLPYTVQQCLLDTPALRPFSPLHRAGWIQMEFKVNDEKCGQVRVYLLPDDIGRTTIDRNQPVLRKLLALLFTQIDVGKATWDGEWSLDTKITHIDATINHSATHEPLFYLFNTLPRPDPCPKQLDDKYARDSMHMILDGNIEGLQTTLYHYQRRSAALMLQYEFQTRRMIDPRLSCLLDQNGKPWYSDLTNASAFAEPRKYEAPRGGICAETMGLGKTLICLALILATRDMSSKTPPEQSLDSTPIRHKTGSLMQMVASRIQRAGIPWERDLRKIERAEGYEFSRCRHALEDATGYYYLEPTVFRRESRRLICNDPRKIWLSTATLVVVPANLVQQWCHEIRKHTTGLKVFVVETGTKLPDAQQMSKFDLLLFNKQRFEKEARDNRSLSSSECFEVSKNSPLKPTYRSPLRDIHFKRLIVDEGHTFGNSSKTEAVTVVDSLRLSARWIVSGTPTQRLHGTEAAIPMLNFRRKSNGVVSSTEKRNSIHELQIMDKSSVEESFRSSLLEQQRIFFQQERKDLEKLGNIATSFLKARPWVNSYEDNDVAVWSELIMQPQHGSKSRGNINCLRATLEAMIIRHRAEDVMNDVTIPPLYQNVIYLNGSVQNMLSLNTFALMIITNAVTSERKDADYFFHPKQRKNLMQLVSNLRQATFFWSNFETDNIRKTIDVGKVFLEKKDVPITLEDEALLLNAIKMGELILSNKLSRIINKYHEMPMFVRNSWPEEARVRWSLDGEASNPTLMGATFLHKAQMFVDPQILNNDPLYGLAVSSKTALLSVLNSPRCAGQGPHKPGMKEKFGINKPTTPALADRLTVHQDLTSKALVMAPSNKKPTNAAELAEYVGIVEKSEKNPSSPQKSRAAISNRQHIINSLIRQPDSSNNTFGSGTTSQSKISMAKKYPHAMQVDRSPLDSTTIISTASAKLSYLMDAILVHHEQEKIIVFYEADNVAYYIAQALECLGIKHLIYAKSLSSTRRSQYVVTFNQSEAFRVLLMDVSQAAFGLDISSASRVYFVNPVFSPQVEAQAVKRAHRIGQTRPVYVEILVLKDSIEEAILDRRKNMSSHEHNLCKSILDDQIMFDWIRSTKFIPVDAELAAMEQMSVVKKHRPHSFASEHQHPDEKLLFERGGTKNQKKRSVNHESDASISDKRMRVVRFTS